MAVNANDNTTYHLVELDQNQASGAYNGKKGDDLQELVGGAEPRKPRT